MTGYCWGLPRLNFDIGAPIRFSFVFYKCHRERNITQVQAWQQKNTARYIQPSSSL